MYRRMLLAFVAVLSASLTVTGQAALDFSITASPTVAVPLGPSLPDGLQYYSIGGGGSVKADIVPGFAPFTFMRLGFDAEILPITGSQSSLALVSAGGSVGLSLNFATRFTARAWGGGGEYMGIGKAGSVFNPYLEAGADLGLKLSPTLNIGLGAKYRDFLTPTTSLYRGLSVSLGLGYNLAGARSGGAIRLDTRLLPIFPLFYTYYDKHPAGELQLTNDERVALENVKVSFYAKQYMDGPRLCAELPSLAPGERKKFPIYALFNDQIFRVTEGTKSAGEIVVEYYYLGAERRTSYPVTVIVNNRNAMTWDDDRKAAAFVAAKNPTVLGFSKSVAAAARRVGAGAATTEIRTALGLFEALRVHGVGYAVDPSTPYEKIATSDTAVDFLQFPQQTLAYKAGDCDDLSIAYAALLEATGTRSAFVLVPGHVFIAVDSGLTPEAAKRLFAYQTDFVERDGTAWLPIEVTLINEGFLKAWRTGTREWREAERNGKLGFFETRKAWETYEPVGISDDGIAVLLPDSAKVAAAYKAELDRFINDQTANRIAELKAGIRTGINIDSYANRLGILYAKFGKYPEAEEQFRAMLKRGENDAALVNLGNLAYIQGNTKEAVNWYQRALKVVPTSGYALRGLARCLYELEDFASLEAVMARLKSANPELAASLVLPGASAAATGRAAEVGEKEIDVWSE